MTWYQFYQNRLLLKTYNSNIDLSRFLFQPEDRLLLKELGPRGDGKEDEIEQLLKEGADPNCLDAERRSALLVAVTHDREQCVKVLLAGGADVNRRSGPHHNSPLHQAVKLGPEGKDIVKLLLE